MFHLVLAGGLTAALLAAPACAGNIDNLINDRTRESRIDLRPDERQLLRRAISVVEERYISDVDAGSIVKTVFTSLGELDNRKDDDAGAGPGDGAGKKVTDENEPFARMDTALNAALSNLDAHTAYLTPSAYKEMDVRIRGEFGGLGLEVTMEDDAVKVVAPIDDTPASRAGMAPGDLITHVDNVPLKGMSLREAVLLMRGPVGTGIDIRVIREGATSPLTVSLVRDIIRIRAVRYHREADVGYIRISAFSDKTEEGLLEAVDALSHDNKGPLRGYVIDLRNNPGGLFSQAIQVADAFLDSGGIVSVRGRKRVDNSRHDAEPGDITHGIDLVVLVNAGSASASEIVAGALQDNRRATVLGSRSFGKGSVQTILPIGIPMGRYGALRLTTALYYTPGGRAIQARGVRPDVRIVKTEADEDTAEIRREEDLAHALTNPGGAEPAASSTPAVSGERCRKLIEPTIEDGELACALALLRLGGVARLASAAAQ